MKVSICIQTYNNEPYIAKAIDSVLMQKVDFEYELIIGEDDSSDNTREIVRKYKKSYPDKIRLFLNSRRDAIFIDGVATSKWNFVNNLIHASGEYISLLDGDDYWTNPNKLQKQVDFLVNHQECAMVFHPVNLVRDGMIIQHKIYSPGIIKSIYSLHELLAETNFISKSSVMVRNPTPFEFPHWFYTIPFSDLPLYILLTINSNIGYIDEVMGTFRLNEKGLYSHLPLSMRINQSVNAYKVFSKSLPAIYDKDLRHGLNVYGEMAFHKMKNMLKDGQFRKSLSYAYLTLSLNPKMFIKYIYNRMKI